MIGCEKCGAINPDDSMDGSRCGASFKIHQAEGPPERVWLLTAKFLFFFVLGLICVIGFIVKHTGPAFIFGPPALIFSFKYLREIQSRMKKDSAGIS